MNSVSEAPWADPGTLRGLLQRGHGAGYLRARSDPGAADLVVECVIRDPRLDHQVEERGWYFAALVAELGIDLARIRPADAPDPPGAWGDDAAWLALEVLELSALRGVPGAVPELRRYLRSGRDVDLALQHLLPVAAHPDADGLLDEVMSVAGTGALRAAMFVVEDLAAEPWPEWRSAHRDVERVVTEELRRRAAAVRATPPTGRREARVRASRGELVRAGREAAPGTPAARLTALAGAAGDEALLEVAPDLLADGGFPPRLRAAVRRLLLRLDSPRALSWARSTASLRGDAGTTALGLLAALAREVDVPRLRRLLPEAAALGEEGIYTQCDLVEALGRLRDTGSAALIESLFDTTVYSCLRARCARALSAIPCSFMARRRAECLYDCERDTRRLAGSDV